MEEVMNKVKNTRILAVIGIAGLFLGTILPYFKISFLGYSQSFSLFGYWEGKIVMLLVVANALFIFKDYIKKYAPQMFNTSMGRIIEDANSKLSLIPTILSAVFAIYLYIELKDTSIVKFAMGFWILWLGVASLIAFAILYQGDAMNTPVATATPQPVPPMTPAQPTQNMSMNPATPSTVATPNNGMNPQVCTGCGGNIDPATNKCVFCGKQH